MLHRDRLPSAAAGAVLASIAIGIAFALPENGWILAGGFWLFGGFASGVLAPSPDEAVGNAVLSGLLTFVVLSVGITVWAALQVESITVLHFLGELIILVYVWTIFTFALLPLMGTGWVGGKVQQKYDV